MKIFISTLPYDKYKLNKELSLLKTALLYSNEKVIIYSNDFTNNSIPLLIDDKNIWLASEARMKLLYSYHCFFCHCRKCEKKCTPYKKLKSLNKTILGLIDEYNFILGTKYKAYLNSNFSYDEISQEKLVGFLNDKNIEEIINTLGYHHLFNIKNQKTKKEIDYSINAIVEINLAIDAGYAIEFPWSGIGGEGFVVQETNRELARTGIIGALDEKLLDDQSEISNIQQHDKRIIDIANTIFSQLPNFDSAKICEIIDIKKEIEKYTINFQSSLIKISKEVKTGIWDKSFVRDVEDSIIQYVLPGVKEIEEAVKTNKSLLKYFPDVINTMKTSSILLPTSIIGAVLVKNGVLSTSAPVLYGCVAATIGSVALDVYKKKKEDAVKIENNGLYLVYKAKDKLNKITKCPRKCPRANCLRT